MNKKTCNEIDFVMFVMYRLSESWGVPVLDVYRTLKSTGALSNYIMPCFDVLHTLGAEYLVCDISEYVKNHTTQQDTLARWNVNSEGEKLRHECEELWRESGNRVGSDHKTHFSKVKV